MKIILTPIEFKKHKEDFSKEIDKFLNKFDDFTRKISPSDWRIGSKIYNDLKNYKKEIPNFKPLEDKHLEQDFIRQEILTPEELEFYNATKKYNL